ncbi:MAG: hypothetical protein V1905_02370 [bacterium]
MRILEFHFNQPKQISSNRPPNKVSRCFCFSPKNIYEKRVGGIFIVGEIVNLSPKNTRLLEDLALTIKQSYYGSPLKSVDISYEVCLKAANNFLFRELKDDNVSWLGNLSCAVVAVKDSSFYYAKIGNIRGILLRDKIITAIGDIKEKSAIRQTKSFNDIIYGNMEDSDRLLIMTKGANTILEYSGEKIPSRAVRGKPKIKENNLIEIISQSTRVDAKQLKERFDRIESANPGISGSCLVIEISDTITDNEPQVFRVEKSSDWFSLKMLAFTYRRVKHFLVIISRLIKQGIITAYYFLKKQLSIVVAFVSLKITLIFPILVKWTTVIRSRILNIYRGLLTKISPKTAKDLENNLSENNHALPIPVKSANNRLASIFSNKKTLSLPIGTLRAVRIKEIIRRIFAIIDRTVTEKSRILQIGANRYLIVSLFMTLVFGFVVFRLTSDTGNSSQHPTRIAIERQIFDADGLINKGKKAEAISVLKQAMIDTKNIKVSIWSNTDQGKSLISQIDSRLKTLYNLENIDQPSVFYKFPTDDFIPQKIILAGNIIYAYSPLSPKIYPLDIKDKKTSEPIIISAKPWQISSATNIFQKAGFFVKPNQLWLVDDNQLTPITLGISTAEEISINDNYDLDSISSFNGNLYFLDRVRSLIIKYPYQGFNLWSNSEIWAKTKNPSQEYPGTGFLSVNGDAWLINSENIISVYRAGIKLSAFSPDTYPLPKKLYRAVSVGGYPYLFIIEPIQKRLIIIDSFGYTVKQYESLAFDNLKDVAISTNGQTAYVLNGLTIYQINMMLNY